MFRILGLLLVLRCWLILNLPIKQPHKLCKSAGNQPTVAPKMHAEVMAYK